jgi:hypothetical protein
VAFRAGQTFLYPLDEDNRTSHLWIIITEPNSEQLFAVASFTSLKGAKDQTVILGKAEHPFLKWETCVSYAQAEIIGADALQERLDRGSAKMHRDATPAVLRLVFDGLLASDFTKNRVREFVRAYKQAAGSSR